MTDEEKQLLLKDLCARLPYWVKVKHYQGIDCVLKYINMYTLGAFVEVSDSKYFKDILENGKRSIFEYKPYLRPMSSMTEEEKEELKEEHYKDEKLFAECLKKWAEGDDSMRGKVIPHFAADWCNKNHFDFRGLIPMGLAYEAQEGMYKTK